MSQMGGVNILDAISPAAAANAREGATASADRGARQQLADQQSLNEGIHTFVDSILTATKMAQEQRMHQQQLASQEKQTQMKITSEEKMHTGTLGVEQQRVDAEKANQQWQQQFQAWQARAQTALSSYTLQLENAPFEAGIGKYGGPPEGESGLTSPSSQQPSAAGGGVMAPNQSSSVTGGTGGLLAGAPPAKDWHALELMTNEDAQVHSDAFKESVFHATKVAAADAISKRLAQVQNSATTSEEKMASVKALIEPNIRSLADGHAAYELIKTNVDSRLDPVLSNLQRAATDRNPGTELGKALLQTDEMRKSLAGGAAAAAGGPAFAAFGAPIANLADVITRRGKDILGLPDAYDPDLDKAVGKTITPAYLHDVVKQMLPGNDFQASRMTTVVDAIQALNQHNMGIDKLTPESKAAVEQSVREGVADLSKMGISHEELDHVLEKISVGSGMAKNATGDDKTYTGKITKHMDSQLAGMSSTFRGVMGGLPVGAKLGDLGANMATIAFVLDGGTDKEHLPAYIDTLDGVSPASKKALAKKISDYYDLPVVKEAMSSRGEIKQLRGQQLTAIEEADKAGVSAKAAEASKQMRVQSKLRILHDQYTRKYQDTVQQLGPPPAPPQQQGQPQQNPR